MERGTVTVLQPVSVNDPIYGKELNRHVQAWLADALSSVLERDMIRPYLQAEPPGVPDKGEAWMAFRIDIDASDMFPFTRMNDDGLSAVVRQNENLNVLCSFYDTGTNGNAQRNASLLRDNATVPGNADALLPIYIVSIGTPVSVPSMLANQWLYRLDLNVRMRREVSRTYGIKSVLTGVGTLHADTGVGDGVTRNITAETN